MKQLQSPNRHYTLVRLLNAALWTAWVQSSVPDRKKWSTQACIDDSANNLWEHMWAQDRVEAPQLHSGLKVDGSTESICWHGYFLKPNGNQSC